MDTLDGASRIIITRCNNVDLGPTTDLLPLLTIKIVVQITDTLRSAALPQDRHGHKREPEDCLAPKAAAAFQTHLTPGMGTWTRLFISLHHDAISLADHLSLDLDSVVPGS